MSQSFMQKRHQARFLLIQALYQWQVSENPPEGILQQFQLNPQFQQADAEYFSDSFTAIVSQVTILDDLYAVYLDCALSELDPIEITILRLATYELSQRLDLPYRVIINEAVELAKTFGGTDGHKY